VASESYNLSWVNCEMASFIHMKASSKFYQSPQDEVSVFGGAVCPLRWCCDLSLSSGVRCAEEVTEFYKCADCGST
jgi:hypothetical protein